MKPNAPLSYTGVLLYVKGDWSEAVHTLGLSMWNNVYAPCQFCSLSRDEIRGRGHCLSCDSPDWALRTHDDYDAACRKCEIHVQIQSRNQMNQLIGALRWQRALKGRNKSGIAGRLIAEQTVINGVTVYPGDRLEPSDWVPDVGKVESMALPGWVTLWRLRTSFDHKPIDCVSHRCPLFSPKLFSSPASTLAVDSLHTLALGIAVRFTSASLWRIILENPWRISGGVDTVIKSAVEFLKADLMSWQDCPANGVDRNRRVDGLTEKMLGKRQKCNLQDMIFRFF